MTTVNPIVPVEKKSAPGKIVLKRSETQPKQKQSSQIEHVGFSLRLPRVRTRLQQAVATPAANRISADLKELVALAKQPENEGKILDIDSFGPESKTLLEYYFADFNKHLDENKTKLEEAHKNKAEHYNNLEQHLRDDWTKKVNALETTPDDVAKYQKSLAELKVESGTDEKSGRQYKSYLFVGKKRKEFLPVNPIEEFKNATFVDQVKKILKKEKINFAKESFLYTTILLSHVVSELADVGLLAAAKNGAACDIQSIVNNMSETPISVLVNNFDCVKYAKNNPTDPVKPNDLPKKEGFSSFVNEMLKYNKNSLQLAHPDLPVANVKIDTNVRAFLNAVVLEFIVQFGETLRDHAFSNGLRTLKMDVFKGTVKTLYKFHKLDYAAFENLYNVQSERHKTFVKSQSEKNKKVSESRKKKAPKTVATPAQ